MGDMKDKFKGFMKKFNDQLSSSSSSGKFKGQGRVLGSSSSGPVNSVHTRPTHTQTPTPTPKPIPSSTPTSSSYSKPLLPSKLPNSDQNKPASINNPEPTRNNPEPTRRTADGFDPFDSLITSSKVSKNGFTLNMFECPICSACYSSEEEVSIHVDACGGTNSSCRKGGEDENELRESRNELETCVSSFLSGKPPEGSVEVFLRLLRNIVKEPGNDKFRKIRMSNPKIRAAVGEVAGGMELLEFVGFELKEEGGEMWAFMDVPREKQISLINKAIVFLQPPQIEEQNKSENLPSEATTHKEESVEPKKIDREVRVFSSVTENIAARIHLPESFYNLTPKELKKEADMRKKKIAESQLLIPKSLKEKQAKAAKRRYRRAIIRIRFPDGVVLQGVFAPWEPTSALCELLDPVKRRVIASFPAAGERGRTLEDEDLVPAVLVKFKPIETDSVVFTGLCNELLQISEPLAPN